MAYIRPRDKNRPNGPQRVDVKRTVDGVQLRWSFPADDPADAEIIAGAAAKDLKEGKDPADRYRVVRRRDGMTVGEWIAVWRVDRGLTPGAQVNERSHLDNHIIPALGSLVIDEGHGGDDRLTRLRVQRWVTRMEDDGYAPRTVRTVYGCLRTLLLDAIDEPSVPISTSPCVRIRLPAVEPTGRRALDPEEVGAILGYLRMHRELGWTLAFTGARVGELLARDVEDWSPLAGLSIPPGTKRRRDGNAAKARGAKTPSGVRTIGLCGSNREMLRDYAASRTAGPLFLNRDGKRVKYDAFLHRLQAAGEAAGLPEVTPHWFRHTVNTWLQEDGCNQLAIDEHMGWKSPGMSRGTYGHVKPSMRAPILASLEARWARARGLPGAGEEAKAEPGG